MTKIVVEINDKFLWAIQHEKMKELWDNRDDDVGDI